MVLCIHRPDRPRDGNLSTDHADSLVPLRSVDGFVTDLVQYLCDKIASGPHDSSVVDLAQVSLYFTLDVITRLAFGEELGFLRTDSDVHSLVEQTRDAVSIAFIPLVVPWFRDIAFSRPFIRFLRPQPTDKKGFGVALK